MYRDNSKVDDICTYWTNTCLEIEYIEGKEFSLRKGLLGMHVKLSTLTLYKCTLSTEVRLYIYVPTSVQAY